MQNPAQCGTLEKSDFFRAALMPPAFVENPALTMDPKDHCLFKLVALDVDGTLLNSNGDVSDELKQMLPWLQALGVRCVLCTGRRWRSALPVVQELEHVDPYVVCCGGSLVKHLEGHETLRRIPLDWPTTRRSSKVFREAGLVPIFLYDRPVDGQEMFVSQQDRSRAQQVLYLNVNRKDVGYFQGDFPPMEEPPLEVFTVDCVPRVRPRCGPIKDALGGCGVVEVMLQPRYGTRQLALEVHDVEATKWTALQWLMADWNIKPQEVLAIGDDVNDIPMLRAAGLSFAMGNAPEEVKSAADAVTATNDQHGAARAIKRVFAERIDERG